MVRPMSAPPRPPDAELLARGEHRDPHAVLGPHDGVVRAYHRDAVGVSIETDGERIAMEAIGAGLWAAAWHGDGGYRLRYAFPDGNTWERGDPYRFPPTVGEPDLHLINEGTHERLYDILGAHPRTVDGVDGVAFAVWAPAARGVRVVGDFDQWQGDLAPMRQLGASGVWELFVPDIGPGATYKYEVLGADGTLRHKADPLGFSMQLRPESASRVWDPSVHAWSDDAWMSAREARDPSRQPMAVYEVHLGSWQRHADGSWLTYAELAPRLAEHCRRFGFTHVELLPIAEHPYDGSWGYQVTGYYAPTARFGTPDELRAFVDTLHQAEIGVILDWVPAHFPRDDFGLRRFDGTPLYEYPDPRMGEHPDWGTLIFNYGRPEVRNFLVANALYWLDAFHVDGLRVDAVASMLYLDYSRKAGEWVPNRYGGRENLDAMDFLREVNERCYGRHPGTFTIAEDSTAFGGMTRPTYAGGIGFGMKWDLGWMHDHLDYFAREPVHRRWHHDRLTFRSLYQYSERWILPLSHDEVVHGKGSLLGKMPGDEWQRFANLRCLLADCYTQPGGKLLFMGTELAPLEEWSHERSLAWELADEPMRAAFGRYLIDLGALYRAEPALWAADPDPEGFDWIDASDTDGAVFAYLRHDPASGRRLAVVMNLTPVVREPYRVGLPVAGRWAVALSSDAAAYGGSGSGTLDGVQAVGETWHGQPASAELSLPPLGVLLLRPAD